ncbi:hypothetical protein BGZ94_000818, partial [Podila epigama]
MAAVEDRHLVLFGKAGSGKSTIANILTQGDLFRVNRSPIGVMAAQEPPSIITLRNNGWVVTDTIGMTIDGDEHSPDNEALKMLEENLSTYRQGFHYIAYVVRIGDNGGIEDYDHRRLWHVFRKYFEEAESNFVLIVTHCGEPGWLDDMRSSLQEIFGTIPYITCDFPFDMNNPRADRDSRKMGLQKLVSELDKLQFDR